MELFLTFLSGYATGIFIGLFISTLISKKDGE